MKLTKEHIRAIILEELALTEKENWAKEAGEYVEKKGTEGEFTEYCDGDVTQACINKAAGGKSTKRKRQAAFAANINSTDDLVYPKKKKKKKNANRKLTPSMLRDMIREEAAAEDGSRHSDGEKLLRRFYATHEGEHPTWKELTQLAHEKSLPAKAIGDAMGLSGRGPIHSDS